MARWLTRVFLVVVCGLLFALGLWYTISFLPHLGEPKSMLSLGSESIRSIEHVFYPVAVAGESEEGLRSYAVRQA